MKVMLINGSPRENGNTAYALGEIAKILNDEGIETEIIQTGREAINDCTACGACHKLGKCVIDDCVNEIVEKAKTCDGFVFGTPVYYAHPAGRMLSLLDRLFFSGGYAFRKKPAFATVCCRRGGASATFDAMNKHFTINEMPVISSTYWNSIHGSMPGEAARDDEGMQTMRNGARNLAWLLKCIEAGRRAGIEPPESEHGAFTNFIR